jgi:hypothetical protein
MPGFTPVENLTEILQETDTGRKISGEMVLI